MIRHIKYVVLIGGILTNIVSSGQVNSRVHRIDRELLLSYDNDLFFLTDQYYSSGANITYSRIIKETSDFYQKFRSKKSDSSKLITRYNYGHQVITSSNIQNRDVEDFDRPYAGWHYLDFSLLNFPRQNVMNSYVVEIGLVGEKSGIGNFHEWWHGTFNILAPRGWDYEIANEPVINLRYNRVKNWRIGNGFDVVTDTGLKIGNGQNRIAQDITLRAGQINDVSNSGFTNSRMSTKLPDVDANIREKEEFIFFYGYSAEYVFSNIFIEGSLFNDESPHVEELEPLVFRNKIGIIYSNYYTSFSIIYHQISKEAVGSATHRYISVSLGFRF